MTEQNSIQKKEVKEVENNIIHGSLIIEAAEFLKDLRVNQDVMDVEFDCETEVMIVNDHDGNEISRRHW